MLECYSVTFFPQRLFPSYHHLTRLHWNEPRGLLRFFNQGKEHTE
ncbi:hypothetical protein WG66_003140 [Moniliophthora roreri]|nr:hypothetical protein WG66_003140 [Moniliophthora roreri]